MPTAVVTGGAGFLGSHLCDFLVADGYRVICVDNLETGSLQNVEHLRSESFVFLNHDITEHLEIAEPRQQGVDTCIVRIFNTYGPRMRPHDGRAIPTFLRQALANEPLTVFGDGSQTRSFCYADDLIRGLVALAQSGEHLPVNIGNPIEYTLVELAQHVYDAAGS